MTDLREHNDLCVGIDLGTTNSVIATVNEKQNGDIVSKVVEISRGVDMYNASTGEPKLTTMKRPTLPSCIYYRQEKNYEPLIGDFAKTQYPLRSHLVAKSIKSQMGKPSAEGLSPDIPDKTPAQISSRILEHLLREASKIYRCKISDAVITVPANFDSSMCKATRDAAELAGITVRNSDGSERPVLLSEPNAVIYDLINQIHNGEVPDRILDLNDKKRVLVFDLGGGTLDITMHEIKRREDNKEILKVDEIATNRYTLLGGDDFDEKIAEAMYDRYCRKYDKYPDAKAKIKKEKNVILPQLRVYAENLKLELNEKCGDEYDSGWDDPDDDVELSVGGNINAVGFPYDDIFTKEEIEQILSVFMASELVYDDYKRIGSIVNTKNIIYPILDVLKKASDKLGIADVAVDAVIVNGGMSKFYMVTDRLKEFFGFDPIVALDPDLAVARGAAVYHYYLHKYEEMQDDMKMVCCDSDEVKYPGYKQSGSSSETDKLYEKKYKPSISIEWGKNILNDSLYLGVKNGSVHEIIPTGAELPYTSSVMTGFKVEPNQNIIAIPIKSKNIDGTYRKIASGKITLKKRYCNGAYISFVIHMERNKVITMKAWTGNDENGKEKIEEGIAEIAIDNNEITNAKSKIVAASGSILQPKEEINNMLQLCRNYERRRYSIDKGNIAKRISACVSGICSAANKEDFASVILNAMKTENSEEAKTRLFVIARKIGTTWTADEKKQLAKACMNQLTAELKGYSLSDISTGPKVNTNIQAIYTMSMCADGDQLKKLSVLHENSKYFQSCLYTCAKTRTDIQWVKSNFECDVKKSKRRYACNIQFSAYAIGIALRKDCYDDAILPMESEIAILKQLCELIATGRISNEEMTSCILAAGLICDQRKNAMRFDSEIIYLTLDTLKTAEESFGQSGLYKIDGIIDIARKMINGEQLNIDEERFLLTKLEK